MNKYFVFFIILFYPFVVLSENTEKQEGKIDDSRFDYLYELSIKEYANGNIKNSKEFIYEYANKAGINNCNIIKYLIKIEKYNIYNDYLSSCYIFFDNDDYDKSLSLISEYTDTKNKHDFLYIYESFLYKRMGKTNESMIAFNKIENTDIVNILKNYFYYTLSRRNKNIEKNYDISLLEDEDYISKKFFLIREAWKLIEEKKYNKAIEYLDESIKYTDTFYGISDKFRHVSFYQEIYYLYHVLYIDKGDIIKNVNSLKKYLETNIANGLKVDINDKLYKNYLFLILSGDYFSLDYILLNREEYKKYFDVLNDQDKELLNIFYDFIGNSEIEKEEFIYYINTSYCTNNGNSFYGNNELLDKLKVQRFYTKTNFVISNDELKCNIENILILEKKINNKVFISLLIFVIFLSLITLIIRSKKKNKK